MNSKATSSALVSSDDVNGTEVYNRKGEHVGEIDHIVIDKKSGKVAYTVMSFGGFLGIGEEHHPIPWGALSYDTSQGGFVTDIDKERLEKAPKHDDNWFADRSWEERAHRHYGVDPYWHV
jgi:sporulation protein YlmC with PRC-barrel domain